VESRFSLDVGGATLVGDRYGDRGPVVVFLHPGVADRRCWHLVVDALSDLTVIIYDRRGFGESTRGTGEYLDVTDLVAVLDECDVERAWLVGSSAGGRVALNAALEVPQRVLGVVALAPAVSGAPPPAPESLEPALSSLDERIDAHVAAREFDDANDLEIALWLDGPNAQRGRVGEPARSLALAMNRPLLEREGLDDGHGLTDVWSRASEITVPLAVACGTHDCGFLRERSVTLAARVPRATHTTLDDVAHLPYLERPDDVVRVLRHLMAAHP
jgi:pimeloyl-ACP methyl ester carboxylesterase